tara:strand:- start:3063 stop:4349 length:1287 start_codon:yes stop_codon:yes gene_type:complete
MSGREVVVTGMGLVTPLGKNVKENWENLKAMKTGITYFPEDGLPEYLQYYGKVAEFDIPENIHPKLLSQMKFLNRGSLLGFSSACEALTHSKINVSDVPPERRALYIASGDFTQVDCHFMYPAIKDGTDGKWQKMDFEKLNSSALNKVNPFFLLESISNNLFSFLSAYFEFMGPNTSLASLSPGGMDALELAHRSIAQNEADIALVVGCGNWITEVPLQELHGLGILSKCKDGISSFKPFDRNRDGFITGEGGAAILLESADAANHRNAEILGKLCEFENCFEPSHDPGLTVPPKVIKRNIEMIMDEVDCDMNDLAFISLHGSGTKKGDASELSSVMEIFGNKEPEIPICGLKSYTGHIGAASDVAEIILGLKAVKDRIIPATLNFEKTEKEFSKLNISSSHQSCEKDRFLSISYGIAGQSTSVIVEI